MSQYGLSSEDGRWLRGLGLSPELETEIANKISRIHADAGRAYKAMMETYERRLAGKQSVIDAMRRTIEDELGGGRWDGPR